MTTRSRVEFIRIKYGLIGIRIVNVRNPWIMKCLNHCIRIDQKLPIMNGKFERKIFFVHIGHVKSSIPKQYARENEDQKDEEKRKNLW